MKMLVGEESSEEEVKQEVKQEEEKAEGVAEEVKGKKKKRKEKNKAKEEQKQLEEQNIEELMKEFTANQPKDNECYKCNKRLTSVTAAECKFCNINFCRQHLLAEQHGCDEAAKRQARAGGKQFDKQLK